MRYFCKATIDRPWKFDSHDLRAFTVIHHFDLNRFPNAIVSTSQTLYIRKTCPRNVYPLQPPLLYSKTGVCKGILIFLIFAPKERFRVLVRTASPRQF